MPTGQQPATHYRLLVSTSALFRRHRNPRTWRGWNRILSMSFESFSKTFANMLPANMQRATYDQHVVPAPGRIYFQAALGIGNAVKFKNPIRPPLLLIAAKEGRTCNT